MLKSSLVHIKKFLELEAAGGILLIACLLVALILANSPAFSHYKALLDMPIYLGITSAIRLEKSLLLWINDGLMTIFFMLLAIEIKREIVAGHLSQISQILLPCVAAIGGIVVPAVIFFIFNHHDSHSLIGWAIPTATDVALALGIVTLLGKRIPIGLKIFLAVLAIFDDMVAIALIAIFYTHDLALWSLLIAAVGICVLLLFNYMNVSRISAYILVGIIIWLAVLKSGIHATLAGVIIGFCIPFSIPNQSSSPSQIVEKALHPWVVYMILPLFALANAGVSFTNMAWSQLWQPITLGVTLGLFLGKQLGIFCFSWLAIKLGFAQLPENSNWKQLYGIAIIAGIGFTMSLFISSLAYDNLFYSIASKMGILLGSFLSVVFGVLLFLMIDKPSK